MSIVTPEWVKDAVFYQVFPDRFARSGRVEVPGPLEDWDAPPTMHGFKGGDLYGVVDRLDELAELGITAIYLTPIFSSASNHRYHTYDYFEVDPLLGGEAALRELLDAAHARGMRVILDGVFNHASRGFWAFNHILECGLASPYLDWFRVDREALAQGRPLRAYPDESMRPRGRWRRRNRSLRHRDELLARLPGLVEHAGPAQAEHGQPAGSRVPDARRRALDPVRCRRLAARRRRRDRRRRVLAGVPAPGQGAERGRLHRRRGLERGPPLAPGRPVRRVHELPARVRRSSRSRRAGIATRAPSTPTSTCARGSAATMAGGSSTGSNTSCGPTILRSWRCS